MTTPAALPKKAVRLSKANRPTMTPPKPKTGRATTNAETQQMEKTLAGERASNYGQKKAKKKTARY